MKIAVMGYGTIGSGVVDVLRINKDKITQRAGEPVEVKYILDLRDFPGDPMEELIVHDYKTMIRKSESLWRLWEVLNRPIHLLRKCLRQASRLQHRTRILLQLKVQN